jgi:APA family basic amino acid/polyamine antiporter
VPLVPILSILFSGTLIIGLSPMTQLRLVVWLVIGLGIYFSYGRRHSALENQAVPKESSPVHS